MSRPFFFMSSTSFCEGETTTAMSIASISPIFSSIAGRSCSLAAESADFNTSEYAFQCAETLSYIRTAVALSMQTTIDLLTRLERANPDKRTIHVILDNAPVNRGRDVRAWLERPECRIKVMYLPPYAPNLNPIERLWKVMHEHVTHNRYYPTFRAFAEAVMRFFKAPLPRTWQSVRDTVNDNFHIIKADDFRVLE